MSELDTPNEPAARQSSLSRRNLLMGAAMLAVGGAAYARMPKRRYANIPAEKFEALFPKSFGTWRVLPSSELIVPPDSEMADKLYQHIVTRSYMNSKGEGVMLLVAYNSEQVNNVQVHRPEICYKASGFDIDESHAFDFKVGNGTVVPSRFVRALRVSRPENIVYWTRIGDEFPQTWLDQRIAMTKANLEGFFADGLLMRASVIDGDPKQATGLLVEFFQELAAHGSPEMRHLAFRA